MRSAFVKLSIVTGILLGLFSCSTIDDMTRYSIGFDSEVIFYCTYTNIGFCYFRRFDQRIHVGV